MVCGSYSPNRGQSWPLQLTMWILLGARGLSHPLLAEPQGHHDLEAKPGLSQPSLTDMGMTREPSTGLRPALRQPVSPRCKTFLDRLRVAFRSRLNMPLLGTGVPQMETLCAADCEDWLDVTCSPARLPVLAKRLCAPDYAPYGQKFANRADLCLSVLGYVQPMAHPGFQRGPECSSPTLPRHRQLRMRGRSLARSRRRARARIPDPAGSGSGSGSGH